MTTMSNDKPAEEIHDRYCAGVPYQLGLREASINAMKAYSAQQLKEYKDVIQELLPSTEWQLKSTQNYLSDFRETKKTDPDKFAKCDQLRLIIDRARKLIDKTDSTK